LGRQDSPLFQEFDPQTGRWRDLAPMPKGASHAGIAALNEKYRTDRPCIFYLFHRPRRWNVQEGVWMGYERKRGKLAALNRCLRGGNTDAFSRIAGDLSRLPHIKYVITLDTDTQLPRDAARQLAADFDLPVEFARGSFIPRGTDVSLEANDGFCWLVTDERGPAEYNQNLSERRASAAKDYLIEQGVSASNLETKAVGEQENLDSDQVKAQLDQNPDLSAEIRDKASRHIHTLVLANNRRVDLILGTTGQLSARSYPFNSEDFSLLVGRNNEEGESGKVQLAAEKTRIEN